ncbi:MAG TPA: sigma-54 dependent transcriptional regulator [Nitrospira sp.]|nr:sigma-54 dependent transcriptional regulator [Nitrospira sp.]
MGDEPCILIVDDDPGNREMLAEALRGAGFHADLAGSGKEAIEKGGLREYDAVFSDIKMTSISGMEVLEAFRTMAVETPVVLMTAFGSVDTAILAMKQGAFDYITKPINLDELVLVARRAVEHCRLVRDHRHLQHVFSERPRAASIIGQSRKIVEVFKLVGKVARTRTAVLIQGESGTGKELIARAIHDNSPRAARPFVAVNCSAITESLLESELFGHVKGSFTGAHAFRRGLLEESSGGTFFLDEVGDLSPAGQAKLLRALQEGEIRRVGGNETVPVDLRVISASRRNLPDLAKAGRFREDLLYRLNTVTITLPPLRERIDDIIILAECFLSRYNADKQATPVSLSPAAKQALLRYHWPGNVRELEHVMERAVALATHSALSLDDLPLEIREAGRATVHNGTVPGTLSALQREHVFKVLESTRGNKEQAARLLGISRRTLYRFLARYGLSRTASASESDALDTSSN